MELAVHTKSVQLSLTMPQILLLLSADWNDTGFKSYKLFKACFDFLGPAAYNLNYWDPSTIADASDSEKRTKGCNRKLSPEVEFLMVMVRLRAGLFERDLAYRFGVSQSTVSRIWIT